MIHKNAFTLIEIIIAITIMAILSTIGFLSLKGWTTSARDSVRVDTIKNITAAIDLYEIDRGGYPDPTDPVDIVHSGATVWTQGGFGKDSARQSGRIFGNFQDPGYEIDYTYSVTNSRKEYQLAYVLENPIDDLTSSLNISTPELFPSAYASGDFSPSEFNPIIWLDGMDVDGDSDTTDNPTNNSNVTTWVNKSTAGSSNNPTLTHGDLKYSTTGFYGGYPGVFIANNRGLRLNNSAITNGDIFYVVQNNDPFDTNKIDTNGRGLQSTTGNYLIGYWKKNRNSIKINNSPSHHNSSPATSNNRTAPFIYGYHSNNSNYSFRDTGTVLAQGAANSISGREWAFNRAGAYNERADFVVSEVLIFGSSLSASEREKVEGYLAHKWGQDYWLPSNHPYKAAPPTGGTPPPAADTQPDAFSLNAITDAGLSTLYVSNTITVSGINTSTAISITGGAYTINSTDTNSYTNAGGTVNNGDIIRVRQLSSSSNSTATDATLTIGGISDTFTVTTLNGDTTPDPFGFNAISNADLTNVYTSNNITVSGINTSTPISISGGDAEYNIFTGASGDITGGGSASASSEDSGSSAGLAFDNNTGTNGWGNNGSLPAYLEYDLGSSNSEIVTKYTLYRSSSQSGGWSNNNYSPSDWLFQGSNNGSTWTTLDSRNSEIINSNSTKKEFTFSNTNSYRYYRIYITKSKHPNWQWVNITEMEMISEGLGSYTSTPGTVNNGDLVTIIMTSAATPGSTETATLTVGSTSEDFSIATLAPDTIPDSFSFTDVEDANLSTQYISNTVTISGINTGTPISISGAGEYSINNNAYTTVASNINSGDTLKIRQSSSASNSQTTSSTINIGGIIATYNVTTPAPAPDTVPDSFNFTDITNATPSSEYISNSITVTGINADTSISISGGQYDLNGSRTYVSSSSVISNGDIISVRNNSSPSVGTTTNATLTIGGISDTFSITTIPADNVPDDYILGYVSEAILNKTYNSNPITVEGINIGTTIDVTGGGGKYSINGGNWESGAGTVYNGDIIIVHLQSLASGNKNVSTELDIGGVKATFDITTLLDVDDIPDAFSFNDLIDANISTAYTDTITVSGINTGTGITITGSGQYSINGGSYTGVSGTVYNGNTVTVRQTSSATKSDSVNSTVTIGGISDIFTVTTIAEEPELANIIERDTSNVYVTGNFNGLFSHGVSSIDDTHYVFITPSIITTDTSNPNFLDIINDKKFVYTGYNNHPSTYTSVDSTLTSTGGFDQYRISGPIIFQGTKQELTSYAGIKQVDNGVRSTYRTTELYRQSAKYLDNYGTAYVEDILGNIIGINPIKPYFCSDILDKQFTENIATLADITATENTSWGGLSGTGGIANGIKSTSDNLDYEYHSNTINAFIDFEWQENQSVGYIRIYNRTGCCSSRLSGATISLYDSTNALLYTHTLWDTTNDYVVDLDLEGIGKLYNNVRKVTITSQGSNSYLNLREVEIYAGGTIEDGFYFVDSDGIGGQRPYEVYCDMTTDGGGWTKIGDNYVLNGDFSDNQHALDYSQDWNREHNIVPLNNPSGKPYAMLQKPAVNGQHANVDYEIIFDDVSSFQVDSELRLSAWIADAWDEGDSLDGGKGYIFQNRMTYKDGSFVENGEKVTLDTQVLDGRTWKLEMVRIPISKEVASFIWEVGNGAETSSSRQFYFADLKAEIYYK